jgi:glycerol dehydrogenase-like iron-containing ADH family enzyme
MISTWNCRRILILGQTDVIKQIEAILRQHDAYGDVFYEIGEHSPIAGIQNGLKKYKEAGADIIVAVGGGSPIDASKVMLYNLQQETGGEFRRQIAIPTTLSAAEYTVSKSAGVSYMTLLILPIRWEQVTQTRKESRVVFLHLSLSPQASFSMRS